MKTVRKWRGLRFTGDTNCGLNYQTGFDECGCPGDLNRPLIVPREIKFGADGATTPITAGRPLSDVSKANLKVQEALSNIRKLFPGPGVCVTGSENLAVYKGNASWGSAPCVNTCTYIPQAIKYMQQTVDDWHTPRGETAYVAAYYSVMYEYAQYYNANCIAAPLPPPSSGVSGNGSTATPSSGGSSDNSSNSSTGTPATTTGSGDPGATPASQPNVSGKSIAATAKKVPTWAWIAGGAAVVLLIVAIAKK